MGGFVENMEMRARNMSDMMRVCRLDWETMACGGNSMAAEQAVRACFFCRYGTPCRQWLDSEGKAGASRPPRFCPNARRFLQVAAGV